MAEHLFSRDRLLIACLPKRSGFLNCRLLYNIWKCVKKSLYSTIPALSSLGYNIGLDIKAAVCHYYFTYNDDLAFNHIKLNKFYKLIYWIG